MAPKNIWNPLKRSYVLVQKFNPSSKHLLYFGNSSINQYHTETKSSINQKARIEKWFFLYLFQWTPIYLDWFCKKKNAFYSDFLQRWTKSSTKFLDTVDQMMKKS